jgi:hypothetical protein
MCNEASGKFLLNHENLYLAEDYNKDNIRIINLTNKSNRCLLFCSGNGLYFPNTVDEYKKRIRIDDRYEWENIAKNRRLKKNISKIIFIRDIYKQWYVTGINNTVNNIDKLIEYLRSETNNYKIITVGNSAGGYIAVLLGIILNAYRIVTISGQYYLWSFVDKNPLLNHYKNDASRSRYYDLRDFLIKNKTQILYIFPIGCENDIEQYNFIRDCENILFIKIDSKNHGAGINNTQYPYIFLCDTNQITQIYKKYKDKTIKGHRFYCNMNSLILGHLYFFLYTSVKILKKVQSKIAQIIRKG